MTLFFLVDRTAFTIFGTPLFLFLKTSSSSMMFVLQEEVRSKLAALEVGHQNEIQRTVSAFARLQKYAESRKEIDRRLDVHFQRRMYVPL